MAGTMESHGVQTQAPVLRVEGVSKRFEAVVAVDDVTLDIHRGEIVGLVGDNGAGKSTLIKIIAGVHQADRGRILVDGQPVAFSKPEDARSAGIETVYQDLALVEELKVDGNLFLGREPTRGGFLGRMFGILDLRGMRGEAKEAISDLRLDVPSIDSASVRRMSGGQRQGVAVARAVHWGSKLLLLDEPTAALGKAQTEKVQDVIRRMRDRELPVVYISHSLPDVFAVCDRIVVMRHGRVVADRSVGDTDMQEVVGYITGGIE